MASFEKKCTEDLFKKPVVSETDSSNKHLSEIDHESETGNENKIKEFNYEDRKISMLYRKVIDDIMESNKLTESTVDAAIQEMKKIIGQSHYKSSVLGSDINFCKPEFCCGYLRRYAICHTGLVKKLMWDFLSFGRKKTRETKDEIVNNNHLKVVSLGGGPGNDLVGFCSALQEVPNSVEKLELLVVDINEGWKDVFPEILRKAKKGDFGSLTQFVKKKLTIGFIEVDLTNDEVFKYETVYSILQEADVLLMVKVTSFLRYEEGRDLIHNVVESMKPEGKLIFIDSLYHKEFFDIPSLDRIYQAELEYVLSYRPKKYLSRSISKSSAHIGIFRKKMLL